MYDLIVIFGVFIIGLSMVWGSLALGNIISKSVHNGR